MIVRRTQPLDDSPKLVTFLQDRRGHPVWGCKLPPLADRPGFVGKLRQMLADRLKTSSDRTTYKTTTAR